ncbi:hypothetical protein U1Q18_041045, partial [Sarracenia purpurea var. burkii]
MDYRRKRKLSFTPYTLYQLAKRFTRARQNVMTPRRRIQFLLKRPTSHSLSLQLRDLYFRRWPSTRRRLSVAPHAKQWDDDDGGDGDMEAIVRGESDYDNPPSSAGGKRKVLKDRSGSSRKREKKSERRERHGSDKAGSKFKRKKLGYSGGQSRDHNDHNGDAEVKEMWDTIVGGDSE